MCEQTETLQSYIKIKRRTEIVQKDSEHQCLKKIMGGMDINKMRRDLKGLTPVEASMKT